MKQLLFFFTTILLTLVSTTSVYATAAIASTFPQQIVEDISLVSSSGSGAVTASASISDKIKNYNLDPIASKIANNLISRATNDTLTWINSGFQGGGPGFIVNPDAYFKNVANQEIRIQLDSINKSNSPYKNAISVALIKNIRTGRTTVGAQLNTTLFSTIQQETCTPSNLTKIATQQVDSAVSTSQEDTLLTRSEKIEKTRTSLYNSFCTGSAISDPQAQAKLQSCFNNGACGGMASTLAAYNPANTLYGQSLLAIGTTKEASQEKIETQKTKTLGGLIPKEVCTERLTVYDTDNPFPPGEGPCVAWNTETPVEAVRAKLDQAITGAYGKISNVHGFGDLLGNLAETFLTNQVEKALYKGLSSVVASKGNTGNINVTYDNLLANNGKALPANLLPTTPAAIASLPLSVQMTKALNYCNKPPEEKKSAISPLCDHMTSAMKTKAVDTSFVIQTETYLKALNTLETCSKDSPDSSYKDKVEKRKTRLEEFGIGSTGDEIKKRLSLFDGTMSKLSTFVIQTVEGKDNAGTSALTEYSTIMSNSDIMIPLQQEKIDARILASLKKQADTDSPALNSAISSCQETLCTDNFKGGCQDQSNRTTPPIEIGGGGE